MEAICPITFESHLIPVTNNFNQNLLSLVILEKQLTSIISEREGIELKFRVQIHPTPPSTFVQTPKKIHTFLSEKMKPQICLFWNQGNPFL